MSAALLILQAANPQHHVFEVHVPTETGRTCVCLVDHNLVYDTYELSWSGELLDKAPEALRATIEQVMLAVRAERSAGLPVSETQIGEFPAERNLVGADAVFGPQLAVAGYALVPNPPAPVPLGLERRGRFGARPESVGVAELPHAQHSKEGV